MTKRRFVIYCHTNRVNGKQYVGLTEYTAAHRWSGHKSAASRGHDNLPFCNAIRKYGHEKFVCKVLVVVSTKTAAKKAERRWIKRLNTLVPHGYNLSSGGESPTAHTTTREKIRKSWRDPKKKAARMGSIIQAWGLMPAGRRSQIAEAARRREAARTSTERASLNRKIGRRVKAGLKNKPPEWHAWRRDRARETTTARWARMSKAKRATILAPMRKAQTLEQRRKTVRKLQQLNAGRTPEERRVMALKAWVTKRERYGADLFTHRCCSCGQFGHAAKGCKKGGARRVK